MDYFHYKQGVYHAEDVAIPAIAEKIGTPFYCYSTATLNRHVEVLKNAFAKRPPKICFAVKANCNLAVLKTLAGAGVGADVVSGGEIKFALAAGIAPENIVFSGVGKSEEEMEFALQTGIFQFNAESTPEVRLLSKVAKRLGKTAPVALRVNPDVVANTHAKISTGHKESKFGISFDEARALYKEALGLKGIKVQGISVHIGSQLTSLEPFAEAFARLAEFVRELRASGIPIQTIDVGGGLGVPYEGAKPPPSPDTYAQVVLKAFEGIDGQLMLEPGRLLVGNAGILVSRVLYTKYAGDKRFLIVDAGMNDLIRPAMYDAFHDIVPVKEGEGHLEPHDVVGPVCESSDVFAESRPLPLMEDGALVAFRTAGAYGAVMACTYNARPLVAEVMVDGTTFKVTRPRGSVETLLAEYTL